MRVLISKNRSSLETDDGFFTITRQAFHLNVDTNDFVCRKVRDIEHVFSVDWFDEGEPLHFHPPICFIKNGKIKFINGRHRTELLLKYLEKIPVIFLSHKASAFSSVDEQLKIKEMIERICEPLKSGTSFNFPELPLRKFS